MAIQLSPDEKDPQRFNDAIRQLTQGRVSAVGTATLTPAATSTVVAFENCSIGSAVFMFPMTANAAAALATTYVAEADVVQGGFTITHANNAQTDRDFWFLCIGG